MDHTISVALLSELERPFDPDHHAAQDAGHDESVQLRWAERNVSAGSRLSTVTIPLSGTPSPDFAPCLAACLDRRWSGRRDLTGGCKILSVTARATEMPAGSWALTLGFVTDHALAERDLEATRMPRELRRAIRDLSRGYEILPAGVPNGFA